MIIITKNEITGMCKAKDFKEQIQKVKDLIEVEKWATEYFYVMSVTENTILMENPWVVTVAHTILEYIKRWKNERIRSSNRFRE